MTLETQPLTKPNVADLLKAAQVGVTQYLRQSLDQGEIDDQLYADATQAVMPNLEQWLQSPHIDRISPNAKKGIALAIQAANWKGIVNAFRRDLGFGTGGIRGMMGLEVESIVRLKEEGIDAPILKGPNTLNNIVLLRISSGVARFAVNKGFSKVVVGFDSRIRGQDFAQAIAELFLAYGFTVFMFDEPCPYPELTFAIPHQDIKADIGILISASHNDYRYNGYKLSSGNGSQFDPEQRDEMYKEYIAKAAFEDIQQCPFNQAKEGKLIFLGGHEKLPGVDYFDRPLWNSHDRHRDHIIKQLANPQRLQQQNQSQDHPLNIAYCAYHGAGRKTIPRLFGELGFSSFRSITENGLNDLNGLFPSFCSDPGKEEQPDPGDPRAAQRAVEAFEKEYPGDFDDIDILVGTDPDADRCGVTVKVPESQRHLYDGKGYALMPADDLWALIVWYRLFAQIEKFGQVKNPQEKFIVQSLPTSDSLVRLALKHNLGVMRTWVGFANLAAAARMVWDKENIPKLIEGKVSPSDTLCHPFVWETTAMDSGRRSFNYAAMEQSNGFSILGGPPPDASSLGKDGHVRDKDGLLAAILAAEVAAYAKGTGTTLYELLDEKIYLDPDIGLFINRYEPDPLDGEYPGIQGDRKKIQILKKALQAYEEANTGRLRMGSFKVTHAVIYRTGKYDRIYPPTDDFIFPDEGIRFYFDLEQSGDRLNWLFVRPSGTGNSLRFHVQLHNPVTRENLIDRKATLGLEADKLMDDIRDRLGAPRNQ